MVSLGSVAMAALYPVLTIIYGSLQGYAAGDMLVCAIGSGFMRIFSLRKEEKTWIKSAA